MTLTSEIDIYETTRTNAPSILGTSTFHQYLSVRQGGQTSGTITFQNHINAWASHGMNLGQWNVSIPSFLRLAACCLEAKMLILSPGSQIQIMATEGYESNGETIVTVNGL
jgi:endo-1,4-beta-xylanase